jgi:hypothetical protein
MNTLQRCCSVLVLASTLAVTGCATHDRRDAPWDPKQGQTLIDQIPNWQGEAQSRCGGHLPEAERGARSPRC